MINKTQTEIPGTEAPSDPHLEELCEGYATLLYRRIELQREEKAAKDTLIQAMTIKGVDTYRYYDGDFEFTFAIDTKRNIACKRVMVAASTASEEPHALVLD